ncbi:GyrI-like domain-containing protein [Metabacillus bambusae]|uniref:AraC family transcriptional regulator n=1 Tax=Metabacillus bambusae TaxID=2795218 RepID=A0ABS3N8N8_9BACI|nr:GyrI-like domain-containing protein [Metabacillus bambusae]MBO1514656.1 AraC family transcriptional regulator [Metabacillus bambusae]
MAIIQNAFIQRKSFQLIGISAVTSNEAEMKNEGVIEGLWGKIYSSEFIQTIPNKINQSIFALYTNYESDETGTYTFVIGSEVVQDTKEALGMEKFEVPEAKYIVFTTRKGPVQEVVIEAWQEIWEWSKTNERAFLSDFEVYDERTIDPENSQVDIYISVK